MQAAFTIKEARELLTLPDVGFQPVSPNLLPDSVASLPRAQKRITQLLAKHSNPPSIPLQVPKSWQLDFLLSPSKFNSDATNPSRLSSIDFSHTHFSTPSEHFSPSASVTTLPPTPQNTTTIPTGLAFRSIGYRSAPLAGMDTLGIPFNAKRGVIPNDGEGRILSQFSDEPHQERQRYVEGMYCAGWVKTGPTGVIASTMEDAFGVAEAIVSDWMGAETTGVESVKDGWEGVRAERGRTERPVFWEDWLKIDAAEKERGKKVGKEREKFLKVEAMLAVLD
jgi:adrenodoxin-NADP+ reductase